MDNLNGASIIRYRENGELITVRIDEKRNNLIEVLEVGKSTYNFKIIKCRVYMGESSCVDKIKSVVPLILKTTKHRKNLEEYILKVYYSVAVSYRKNNEDEIVFQNFETFLDLIEPKKDVSLKVNNVRWKYINNNNIEVTFRICLENLKKGEKSS